MAFGGIALCVQLKICILDLITPPPAAVPHNQASQYGSYIFMYLMGWKEKRVGASDTLTHTHGALRETVLLLNADWPIYQDSWWLIKTMNKETAKGQACRLKPGKL